MSWLLVTYRLPSEHSRARVTVWREVRRSGALQLQQSLVAFPTPGFEDAAGGLCRVVAEVGGSSFCFRSEPNNDATAERLVAAWNAARDAEYGELASDCEKLVSRVEHKFQIDKFTLAELEEKEIELDKLRRWHERIAARDLHRAAGGPGVLDALDRARGAFERYSEAVFERTDGGPVAVGTPGPPLGEEGLPAE